MSANDLLTPTSWNRRGINIVDKEDIIKSFEKEGFFITTKDTATITVKSFSRYTGWLDERAGKVLDLTKILNKRELQIGYSWSDIFQTIEQFAARMLDNTTEYHIALETTLSVSFTTGRILNSKSGIKVNPIQKTLDGPADWKRGVADVAEYSKFLISNEQICPEANEAAISVGITHNIHGAVQSYIESSQLKIGLHKSFLLEDFGNDAVKNGDHAWQLAKQISREIGKDADIIRKGKLHLFIAVPGSVAFYLGMQSMMYGKIQMYEFDSTENTYYPTISFPQEGEL